MILMLVKHNFLKKNHTAQRMHLNILLDTMIMMSLDHYAKKFNENATMFFRANNEQLLKNYNKVWE